MKRIHAKSADFPTEKLQMNISIHGMSLKLIVWYANVAGAAFSTMVSTITYREVMIYVLQKKRFSLDSTTTMCLSLTKSTDAGILITKIHVVIKRASYESYRVITYVNLTYDYVNSHYRNLSGTVSSLRIGRLEVSLKLRKRYDKRKQRKNKLHLSLHPEVQVQVDEVKK